MIKKILQGNDLKNNIYDIVDTTQQSFDYFCVDLPERFYIGKNPLTIKPTNNLLKGSPIKIDIVDVDGNFIYYEITDIITDTNSRLISVYIYPDIALGNITVYISGVDIYGKTILWQQPRMLSYKEIDCVPVYSKLPNIILEEQYTPTNLNVASFDQVTQYSNGNLLTIKKNISEETNNKLTNYIFPNYTTPLKTKNNGDVLNINEIVIGKRVSTPANLTAFTTENPKIDQKNYSVITTTQPYFSQSMVNSWMYINLKSEIEKYNIILPNTTEFSNYFSSSLVYSSSIIEIIDNKTAIIYPKFNYRIKFNNTEYFKLDNLLNYENFSSSYSLPVSGSINANTVSNIYFQFHNLSPEVGKVDNVNIYISSKGSLYKKQLLSKEVIKPVDLFVDSNNFFISSTGPEFKRFGFPTTNYDVSHSWTYSYYGNVTASFSSTDNTSEYGIIYLSHSRIYNNDYAVIYTTSSYDFIGLKDTEYSINFSATNDLSLVPAYRGKFGKASVPRLDVYLSGSAVQSKFDLKKTTQYIPQYGNFIGSITNDVMNYSTSFIPKENSYYKLYFVIRGGAWKIRKLQITPDSYYGFTPNVSYVRVQSPDSLQGIEVDFDIYFGNKEKYSQKMTVNNFYVSGTKS